MRLLTRLYGMYLETQWSHLCQHTCKTGIDKRNEKVHTGMYLILMHA